MDYDLIIDYDELMEDRQVNIQIKNCTTAALWQYSLVNLLMTLVNAFSPVKFGIYFE